MALNKICQLQGPFVANHNYVADIKEKLNITSTLVGKVGVVVSQKTNIKDFYFNLNANRIYIGKTCMYDSIDSIQITSIQFPQGAPQDTYIDINTL